MAGSDLIIRDARERDLPALLQIYNHVVEHSTAIYSEELWTLSDISDYAMGRIAQGFPFLVAEREGDVIGYGTYGTFRARSGYRLTVEHSVHVAPDCRGMGVGRALIEALIQQARAEGYHIMLGAIDSENQGSIEFHARAGFVAAASLPQVAFKFGRWLDVIFMSLKLSDTPPPEPEQPR